MKHINIILATILSVTSISSCFYPYNQIIREHDPYKNENRIYITFLLQATTSQPSYGFIRPFKPVNLKFVKALDLDTDSLKDINLYISVNSRTDKTIKNPIFFKIDDEIIKYDYTDIDNVYFTENETCNNPTKINTINKTTYSTSKKIRSSVKLSKSLLEKILYSTFLNIRFYINESPYDITFTHDNHKKLKKFIKESAHNKK